MTRKHVIAAGVAGVALATLGLAATEKQVSLSSDSSDEPKRASVALPTFDPLTQYQGVCTVVTPPDPDPCDAANGMLRYSALYGLSAGTYHSKWVAANPGEVQRLGEIMAAPVCSVPSTPQPQTMRTQYGAGLAAIMQAIACARHPESITWPELSPPPSAGRKDKTPPTAPGPITVTPSG